MSKPAYVPRWVAAPRMVETIKILLRSASPPWWFVWTFVSALDFGILVVGHIRDDVRHTRIGILQAITRFSTEDGGWAVCSAMLGFLSIWPAAGLNPSRTGSAVGMPVANGRRIWVSSVMLGVLLSIQLVAEKHHLVGSELLANIATLFGLGIWIYTARYSCAAVGQLVPRKMPWLAISWALIIISRWVVAWRASQLPF